MQPAALLEELDRQVMDAVVRGLPGQKPATPAPPTVPEMLVAALRAKLEAVDEAALWMSAEADLELKLGLARQCGDEARHYRLIAERLWALGADLARVDPLARGHSRLFRFLKSLETTAERLAAGTFAREGLSRLRGAALADLCDRVGDRETAALYREVIGPDEAVHHELGRRLLPRLAATSDDQERARRAVARTLQLADELQDLQRLRQALSVDPGAHPPEPLAAGSR